MGSMQNFPGRNVVTPWNYGDREYIISLSVIEQPRVLAMSIVLNDKITGEEWNCHYDREYIENLTKKTGNFKPFNTFITMIKSAILNTSNCVKVELCTLEDLRTIKNQKHREGIVVSGFVPAGLGQGRRSSTELHEEPYLSVSSAALLNTSNSKQGQGDDEYKTKFLIVTYKAEFDSVKYPIRLVYSGSPNPGKMRNIIAQLNFEINQLKITNSKLQAQNSSKGIPVPATNGDHQTTTLGYELDQQTSSSASGDRDSDSMTTTAAAAFMATVNELEQKFVTQKLYYESIIEKLKKQNTEFAMAILELKERDTKQRRELKQIQEEIASFQNDKQKHGVVDNRFNTAAGASPGLKWNNPRFDLYGGSRKSSRKSGSTSHTSLQVQYQGSSTRTRSTSKNSKSSNDSKLSSRKSSSSRSGSSRLASREGSPSPSRSRGKFIPFDPTAYVREKKMNQDDQRKKRMAEIKADINIRRTQLQDLRPVLGDPVGISLGSHQSRSRQRSRLSGNNDYDLTQGRSRTSSKESSSTERKTRFNFEPSRHTKERIEERRRSRSSSHERLITEKPPIPIAPNPKTRNVGFDISPLHKSTENLSVKPSMATTNLIRETHGTTDCNTMRLPFPSTTPSETLETQTNLDPNSSMTSKLDPFIQALLAQNKLAEFHVSEYLTRVPVPPPQQIGQRPATTSGATAGFQDSARTSLSHALNQAFPSLSTNPNPFDFELNNFPRSNELHLNVNRGQFLDSFPRRLP